MIDPSRQNAAIRQSEAIAALPGYTNSPKPAVGMQRFIKSLGAIMIASSRT